MLPWVRRVWPGQLLPNPRQGWRIGHRPVSVSTRLSRSSRAVYEAMLCDRLSFLAPHHKRLVWPQDAPHRGWDGCIEITVMGHKLNLAPELPTVGMSIPFLVHCDHCKGIKQTPALAVRCKCQQAGKSTNRQKAAMAVYFNDDRRMTDDDPTRPY